MEKNKDLYNELETSLAYGYEIMVQDTYVSIHGHHKWIDSLYL